MLRSCLLALCLLVCLACATPTPFPVENLKVGMTTKQVRQSVGEPRFNHLGKTWIYTHEEQDWVGFVVKKDVFLHFDEEKLVQWQVTEHPPRRSSSDFMYPNDFMHQVMGHPGHIHGDGC